MDAYVCELVFGGEDFIGPSVYFDIYLIVKKNTKRTTSYCKIMELLAFTCVGQLSNYDTT